MKLSKRALCFNKEENMLQQDLKDRPKYLIIIGRILNIIVLLCSLVIFLAFSIETLNGPGAIPHQLYMRIQLAICIFFLIDFFYLLFISTNKWHYLLYNWLFFIIAIPYLNLVDWFHLEVNPFTEIILKAILLIRGGYGLVIMIAWFTTSKMTNLLFSYIAILVGSAYFGSLAFYSLEKSVNSGIKDFGDAAWWACMDVTTVGCAIEPVTSEGRILAVILAVMGMSMFPILTAYITNRFQQSFIHKQQVDQINPGQPVDK